MLAGRLSAKRTVRRSAWPRLCLAGRSLLREAHRHQTTGCCSSALLERLHVGVSVPHSQVPDGWNTIKGGAKSSLASGCPARVRPWTGRATRRKLRRERDRLCPVLPVLLGVEDTNPVFIEFREGVKDRGDSHVQARQKRCCETEKLTIGQ